MFLINVKNGQHFCLPHDPCQIFKRICDYTRVGTDWHSPTNKIQVECWDLAAGEDVIFFKPKITKVIPLGKASKKKTI